MDINEIKKLISWGKYVEAINETIALSHGLPLEIRNKAIAFSGSLNDCLKNKKRGLDVNGELHLITFRILCLLDDIELSFKGKYKAPCTENKKWINQLEEIKNEVLRQWSNENSKAKNNYYEGILADIDNQMFSLEKVGNYTYSKTQAYLLDRIKTYEHLGDGLKIPPSIDFQNTTFNKLKDRLLKGKDVFERPVSVNVRGTIFLSALLSSGWWDRLDAKEREYHNWKDGLQNWLFKGFDLWGPSWDFSWHSLDDDSPFAIAQLGDGEEANTIPVIIPKNEALQLKSSIENSNYPWGGKEVQVSGVLGHKKHFMKKIRKLDIVGGLMDYCIFLDCNNNKHKIAALRPNTEIYSGYLWKCVVPKSWVKNINEINLDDVYFIWEHTDFTKKDALKYNLDSLGKKERYIEKLYGNLVLLQKSSEHVPGKTLWNHKLFYDFLCNNPLTIR